MPTVRYLNSKQVTLDANGNGTLTIDGPKPGQSIQLNRVVVNNPTTKRIPHFTYYVGAAIPPNAVSTSATGQRDTDSNPNLTLHPGEYITAVWSGGDAASISTISLYGVLSYVR